MYAVLVLIIYFQERFQTDAFSMKTLRVLGRAHMRTA